MLVLDPFQSKGIVSIMFDFHEMNALGQALNSSWGATSTIDNGWPSPAARATFSLKGQLINDTNSSLPIEDEKKKKTRLAVCYVTVVTFSNDQEMFEQQRMFAKDAKKLTREYLNAVKKSFRAATGRAMVSKVLDPDESVELFTSQPHISPVKRAYYRYIANFDVS